jgi:hypothetical protein
VLLFHLFKQGEVLLPFFRQKTHSATFSSALVVLPMAEMMTTFRPSGAFLHDPGQVLYPFHTIDGCPAEFEHFHGLLMFESRQMSLIFGFPSLFVRAFKLPFIPVFLLNLNQAIC